MLASAVGEARQVACVVLAAASEDPDADSIEVPPRQRYGLARSVPGGLSPSEPHPCSRRLRGRVAQVQHPASTGDAAGMPHHARAARARPIAQRRNRTKFFTRPACAGMRERRDHREATRRRAEVQHTDARGAARPTSVDRGLNLASSKRSRPARRLRRRAPVQPRGARAQWRLRSCCSRTHR